MKFGAFGTDFPHERGEFCTRRVSDEYFFGYFFTDFAYENDGVLCNGKAGDMLITESGKPVYHGGFSETETGFINDWAYIKGDDLISLLKKFPLPVGKAFHVERNYLRTCIESVAEELILKRAGYEEKINGSVTEFIINVYRDHAEPTHPLDKTRFAVKKDVAHGWTLKEMAETCGYSVSRFSVLYKEKFGVSPKEDLLSSRIETAKQMLEFSSKSVEEISVLCGFNAVHFFSAYFKKETGVSPREFRKTKIIDKK
ncbi:MAG: AraC family transcriptional regulator [Clostridia bacterium]|nr:AraC family transcriptional regulator [Clostridia bacterium]